MKKFTLLLLLILPFLGFGQKTYDFTNSANPGTWVKQGASTSATTSVDGMVLEFGTGTPRLDITRAADPFDATTGTHAVVTIVNNSTEVGSYRFQYDKNGSGLSGTQFLSWQTGTLAPASSPGAGVEQTLVFLLTSTNYANDISSGSLNDTDLADNMEYIAIAFRDATGADLTGDSATNGNIIIKKIEIVNAGVTIKNDYNFATDNIAGFTGTNGTVTNGGTTINFAGNNISLVPKLAQTFYSVDASNKYVYLEIAANNSNIDQVKFQFVDAGSGVKTGGNKTIATAPTTLLFDVSGITNWTGTINEWRLVFSNTGGAPVDLNTINISKIEFSNTTRSIADTGWGTNTTWLGELIPTATDDVIINNNVVVGVNRSANNVTVTSNGSLAFNNGNSLTLTGNLINEDGDAGSVIIRNTSNTFSSLIVDGTVTGNVRHRRNINGLNGTEQDNDLIASAVAVTNFTTIGTGNLVQDPNSDAVLFGIYNNTTPAYEYWLSTDTGKSLNPGTGYVAGASADPGALFNFEGTVTTTQVDVSISDESGSGGSPWNLIGNPYPSYVDFDDFYGQLVTDGVLESGFVAIYGYDADITGDGSKWTIWDSANGEKIAPGQGFFVRSNSTGGNVTFTPAMRTTGTSDDFISGRVASNSVKAVLTLAKNSNTYTTNLYFTEGKTRGLDYGGDTAGFSGPGSSTISLFTSLVEDNNGLELYNQALPYDDFNDVVVPLGVVANIGEQITLSLNDGGTTIPSNINVYLEDNVANTWTLLNTGDYTLTPTAELNDTGRFFVHFTTSTLSAEENVFNGLQIYMDQPSRAVRVKGQLASDTKAIIYDIQGRQVLEQLLNNDTTDNSIHVNSLNTGIYLVQLNNRTQNITQKVIIR